VDPDGQRSGGSGGAQVTGTIIEQLPSALYRVRLDDGQSVTAHVAERLDRNFIRLLVGDRVWIELSPMDRGRGRVVKRLS
jgi:translation initiation factor IF-1